MENYNIYNEIGRGTHSFVYKARRKRSIEYVAVKSTAKSRMDKVLNEVPFLHKLDSPYVLKFFEWYESSNHIWVILEYCMGGDLLNLITQDKQLPETAVKIFGLELVAGLQYLHSNGILYCDLKPANILIDEFGSLKFADFGLARRIPTQDTTLPRPLAPGSPHYMAPELFQQPAVHSFASDFWALGCVLYELRTGRQPFTHSNFPELARMIQTETVSLPAPGCDMSPAFCDLLDRLLTKDPYQRITWDELIDHQLWHEMDRIQKVVMPAQDIFDRSAPETICNSSSSESSSSPAEPDAQHDENEVDETSDANSLDNQLEQDDDNPAVTGGNDANNDEDPQSMFFANDEIRPASAPQSRVPLSQNPDVDDYSEQAKPVKRVSKAPHSAPPIRRQAPRHRKKLTELFARDGGSGGGLRKATKLIFTAADSRVKSVVNNKIGDLDIPGKLPKFDGVAPEDLLATTTDALEKQLKEIYVCLKAPHDDMSEKLSVMTYLFSLCCHARLAHVIVNSSLLKLLIRLLAQEARIPGSNNPMVLMLCLVLGILFRFATFIAPTSLDQLLLLVKTLLRVVHGRSNAFDDKSPKGRSGLQSRPLALACLGELIFYISTQHEWELPLEGVDCVLSCLEDSDHTVRYNAVRTLGNMFIQCDGTLLSTLLSEKVVLALIRGLLQYATAEFEKQNDTSIKFALRTTTTETLAQALRHLRTSSTTANLSPQLKRSVMLFFAKPDVLSAIWRGVETATNGSYELAISSLNIVNAFLDMKMATDREAEFAAIKASRSLLLERTIPLPVICKLLDTKNVADTNDTVRKDALTTLHAKLLLLLHLGIQLNRSFMLVFIQHHTLDLVERLLAPIADHLCADFIETSAPSPRIQVPALEVYLAQCALNVCKLAIRMALKLGADCFSYSAEHEDNGNAGNNNAEHRAHRISSAPFELFSDLIRNPTCRLQLLYYFEANDSKQFTFFLRLMTKLLVTFADEALASSGEGQSTTTAGAYVTKILVDLFESASTEATNIVSVEKQVLFSYLLPAVTERIYSERTTAANCLRILHIVLLDFDYGESTEQDVVYGIFVRSQLIPSITLLLTNKPSSMDENIRNAAADLLSNLGTRNGS